MQKVSQSHQPELQPGEAPSCGQNQTDLPKVTALAAVLDLSTPREPLADKSVPVGQLEVDLSQVG